MIITNENSVSTSTNVKSAECKSKMRQELTFNKVYLHKLFYKHFEFEEKKIRKKNKWIFHKLKLDYA